MKWSVLTAAMSVAWTISPHGEIQLAQFDLGGGLKHHLIPLSWVEYIDDAKVHLSVTKDDAKSKWREKH